MTSARCAPAAHKVSDFLTDLRLPAGAQLQLSPMAERVCEFALATLPRAELRALAEQHFPEAAAVLEASSEREQQFRMFTAALEARGETANFIHVLHDERKLGFYNWLGMEGNSEVIGHYDVNRTVEGVHPSLKQLRRAPAR